MPHALIVDDDLQSNSILHKLLSSERYSVCIAASIKQAKIQIASRKPDLIMCGLSLSNNFNFYIYNILGKKEKIKIILMAEEPNLENAIEAFRHGASDYLTKPINVNHIKSLLIRLEPQPIVQLENKIATRKNNERENFEVLLGESLAMKNIFYQIERVAPTEASVLLLGESGTGKELVAQTIHTKSARYEQSFLPLNCGAISPQLIESEIFGHEKGSFTGAERQHKGYFERTSGGTLFLDEVAEMPIELQVKLLRVLETGGFMRIGSNQEIQTNVRIIAATNRHPEKAISEGKLRLDLYHRLNVFPIKIPPLRERGQDIGILANYFLDDLNKKNLTEKYFSSKLCNYLYRHEWPGNVRELRNFIHRSYILADKLIDAISTEPEKIVSAEDNSTLSIQIGTSLAEIDRKLIFATLKFCNGIKKNTADILGISLKTLYNRLEKYGSHEKPNNNSKLNNKSASMSEISGKFLN